MSHEQAQDASLRLYGLMAEFEDEAAIVRATEQAVKAGYKRVEAYTPYPVEEIFDLLHLHKNNVALVILIGGLLGCTLGFFVQYFSAVIHYPINVGGRPLNSWPSFIPVMFESTVLFAAISAIVGMLVMNRLPQPYHPVFEVERFQYAMQDRFFLFVDADDARFDPEGTRRFLETLNAHEVSEVEA